MGTLWDMNVICHLIWYGMCVYLKWCLARTLTRELGRCNTVKPRPEAHMDVILFEVCLKNIQLIPQEQIVQ